MRVKTKFIYELLESLPVWVKNQTLSESRESIGITFIDNCQVIIVSIEKEQTIIFIFYILDRYLILTTGPNICGGFNPPHDILFWIMHRINML